MVVISFTTSLSISDGMLSGPVVLCCLRFFHSLVTPILFTLIFPMVGYGLGPLSDMPLVSSLED